MINFTEIDKEFKVVVGKGLRPFLIYKKNWQYDTGCTVYTVSEAFEKVKNGEGAFFPNLPNWLYETVQQASRRA